MPPITLPIKTPRNWQSLKPHPLATAMTEFGTGIDMDAAAAHMREHGYDDDEPIIIHEKAILDGRHRLAIAKVAGIVPKFRLYNGKDAMAYVLQRKAFRQHLSASQRAMLATKLAKHNAERQLAPTNGEAPDDPFEDVGTTLEDAAEALNVGSRSVDRAQVVHAKGTPKLVAAVEAGEITVSRAAEIAELPAKAQDAQVALILGGEKTAPNPQRKKPEAILPNTRGTASGKKNGSAVFDWSDLETKLGSLIRTVDKAKAAYPGSEEFEEAFNWMEDLTKILKEWKNRVHKL